MHKILNLILDVLGLLGGVLLAIYFFSNAKELLATNPLGLLGIFSMAVAIGSSITYCIADIVSWERFDFALENFAFLSKKISDSDDKTVDSDSTVV